MAGESSTETHQTTPKEKLFNLISNLDIKENRIEPDCFLELIKFLARVKKGILTREKPRREKIQRHAFNFAGSYKGIDKELKKDQLLFLITSGIPALRNHSIITDQEELGKLRCLFIAKAILIADSLSDEELFSLIDEMKENKISIKSRESILAKQLRTRISRLGAFGEVLVRSYPQLIGE